MKPEAGCCDIAAVVTVDSRGQLVLPKDLRLAAGIQPGDRLAVVVMKRGEEVCCLSLMKTDAFSPMVRQVLAPVMNEMQREENA